MERPVASSATGYASSPSRHGRRQRAVGYTSCNAWQGFCLSFRRRLGSGKSTLVAQVRSLVEGLDFSISYTTRAPRGSETDGREYYFTDRATFEMGMQGRRRFSGMGRCFRQLLWDGVQSALENARTAGKDLLLDIDVQGAKQIMQRLPEAVSIFILPPSPEVLEMRLRNRSEAEHMTSEEVIERRLQQARAGSEAGVGLQVRAGE